MPSQAMIDSAKRGPYDEVNTPAAAFRYIEPYCINPIWECAPGEGKLVDIMALEFRTVVTAPSGHDFLEDAPIDKNHWSMICTNPPFSKKTQFLRQCEYLDKPWALLLPVTTLGNHYCHPYLIDAEILFLPRRIDFTGKGRPWFSVAWFTRGLNFGKQLNFAQ